MNLTPEQRHVASRSSTRSRFLRGSGTAPGSRLSWRPGPRDQRGWIGLVGLLLALAIVGWLAMSALKGYGLAGKPAAPAPGAPPSDPRERARAVEQTVIERSRETARQIEEAEKP